MFVLSRNFARWMALSSFLVLVVMAHNSAGAQEKPAAQDQDLKQKTDTIKDRKNPGQKKPGNNKKNKSRKNKVETEFSGRLMYDFDQFDGFYNEGRSGSDSGLRRGRVAVESRVKDQWSAYVEFSFDKDVDNVQVQEANFSYRGWRSSELVIGKSKEPFGLERSTSSKYISTIERSAVTSAFTTSKNNGLALHSRNTRRHTWAIGLFEAAETSSGVDTWAVTGRYTFSPLDKKRQLLHFGVGGSVRDLGRTEYEVQQEVEVNFADELDYGPKVIADRLVRVGLETAWVAGRFSLQGEWFGQQLTVDNPAEDDDASYSGFYLLASVFLTGESRPYKNGRFRRVKPEGAGGAWELVGRYSVLDAVDNNDGVKSETITLGLNFYAGSQFRLMGNLVTTSLSGPDADEETSGDAVSLRAQYAF